MVPPAALVLQTVALHRMLLGCRHAAMFVFFVGNLV